jgi:hypothetical protein
VTAGERQATVTTPHPTHPPGTSASGCSNQLRMCMPKLCTGGQAGKPHGDDAHHHEAPLTGFASHRIRLTEWRGRLPHQPPLCNKRKPSPLSPTATTKGIAFPRHGNSAGLGMLAWVGSTKRPPGRPARVQSTGVLRASDGSQQLAENPPPGCTNTL